MAMPVQTMRRSFLRRIIGFIALSLLAILAAIWWLLRQSLPLLGGEWPVPGLAAAVTIERDANGVPSIVATSQLDAARALGFLHGQDRFFQMDAARRSASGELSSWLGEALLERDQRARTFNFTDRAQAVFRRLPEADKAYLEAYTEGVNAGLRALPQPPFEYLFLRQSPDAWMTTDSLLVGFAMAVDLQDEFAERDRHHGIAAETLPHDIYEFFAQNGSIHEAPLVGPNMPLRPIPDGGAWDYLRSPTGKSRQPGSPPNTPAPPPGGGSNAFAVGGSLTPADRGALLASDMHLRLNLPHVWYRASLSYDDPDASSKKTALHGVTLPGLPLFIVASNGSIAWGLTVSYVDTQDLLNLELHPEDPRRYRTPTGWETFTERVEHFNIRKKSPARKSYDETIWGPVVEYDASGKPHRALRWTALQPWSLDLSLRRLERMTRLEELIAQAPTFGVPSLNIVAAARDGRIAWSLLGRLPQRHSADASTANRPLPASASSSAWAAEPLPPEQFPHLLGDSGAILVSANQRKADIQTHPYLGDAGWDADGRARQIRQKLETARDNPQAPRSEKDFLNLQLDEQAVFYQRWHGFLQRALDDKYNQPSPMDPRFARAREHLEAWDGFARADSLGFRLLRDFYSTHYRNLAHRLLAPCYEADADFNPWHLRLEEAFAQLLEAKPASAAPDLPGGWDAEIRQSLTQVLDQLEAEDNDWESRTWGARNTLRMQHPFSRLIPQLSRFLDMPKDPQSGDLRVPRVADRQFGASMRLVVAPGKEEDGILHLPGGISGHPLSPFYRAGHEDWLLGRPSPLLPGPAQHRLILRPPE
jgi:penicillin G amidase